MSQVHHSHPCILVATGIPVIPIILCIPFIESFSPTLAILVTKVTIAMPVILVIPATPVISVILVITVTLVILINNWSWTLFILSHPSHLSHPVILVIPVTLVILLNAQKEVTSCVLFPDYENRIARIIEAVIVDINYWDTSSKKPLIFV